MTKVEHSTVMCWYHHLPLIPSAAGINPIMAKAVSGPCSSGSRNLDFDILQGVEHSNQKFVSVLLLVAFKHRIEFANGLKTEFRMSSLEFVVKS